MEWVKAGSLIGPKGEDGAPGQQVKTINGQSILGTGDLVINTNAPLWVSGTAYTNGSYVVSPLSSHLYMKKTSSGASSVDPANDKTNWRLIGAGGIKSVQRGAVSMSATTTSAAVTISPVDPDFSELSLLGVDSSAGGSDFTKGIVAALELTSATTIRVNRGGSGTQSMGAAVVKWQLVERWS